MAKIHKVKYFVYLEVVISSPFYLLSTIFRKYLESKVPDLVLFICIICVPLPPPCHSTLAHVGCSICPTYSMTRFEH